MGLAVQQLAVDEGCHFLGGYLAIYFHCFFDVSSNSNGGKYSAFFEPVFAPRSLPACGTLVTFVCFHCSLHLFSDSLCFKHDFPLVIFVAVYIHDFMIYIFLQIHTASEYSNFLLFHWSYHFNKLCWVVFLRCLLLDRVTQVIDRFDTCGGGGACYDRFSSLCRAALRFAVTPSATLSGCKLKSARRTYDWGPARLYNRHRLAHTQEREYPRSSSGPICCYCCWLPKPQILDD